MPEYPQKETITTSTGGSFNIGSGIPVWHSLSQSVLEANGWVKVDKLYLKDNMTVEYTGAYWILNGKERIDFLEEIKDKK